MKLYDVPRNTYVRLLEDNEPPPAGIKSDRGQIIKFGHIDGMYSYCTDTNGNTVHLKAWTEVEIVSDYP